MVGVHVLLEPVRFLEGRLEGRFNYYRRLFMPSERVEGHFRIGTDEHIINLVSKESILSERVPLNAIEKFSLYSGIGIERVPSDIRIVPDISSWRSHIMAQEAIADTSLDL